MGGNVQCIYLWWVRCCCCPHYRVVRAGSSFQHLLGQCTPHRTLVLVAVVLYSKVPGNTKTKQGVQCHFVLMCKVHTQRNLTAAFSSLAEHFTTPHKLGAAMLGTPGERKEHLGRNTGISGLQLDLNWPSSSQAKSLQIEPLSYYLLK